MSDLAHPMTYADIQRTCGGFTGTEKYHSLRPFPVVMTDGVAWFFTHVAGWLITDIAAYWGGHQEPFQVWTLTVDDKKKGELVMREDTHAPALVSQHYTFCDLPTGTYKFYLCQGEHPVLMLPSEY